MLRELIILSVLCDLCGEFFSGWMRFVISSYEPFCRDRQGTDPMGDIAATHDLSLPAQQSPELVISPDATNAPYTMPRVTASHLEFSEKGFQGENSFAKESSPWESFSILERAVLALPCREALRSGQALATFDDFHSVLELIL
jgi:hypothetical protein